MKELFEIRALNFLIFFSNMYMVTETEPVIFVSPILLGTMNVGPCHHGMARPQVADERTASYMEGSCE
jgi:hypothetical protein